MSDYNIIYPDHGRILLDGGLNNKFEKSVITERESPDCQNVSFQNGAVATRGGITKLNTTAVGSFVCDGLYTRRSNAGAETMVAWFGGTLWQLNVTTFSTIPSAQSVFTAGIRVGAAQYENHIFFGNGSVTPYKYNGTHFTRHGVPAPTATMTVASNGAGNLAGDYRYRVTYVNSQSVEGNVSPISVTFTATATGSILRVSNIPTAVVSYGVSARRLYRTNAGGSTFFRVTEIADNSTTTYDDNIASSAVGVSAPTDNGEPPNYSNIIYHANRLFTNDPAHPNYVWHSELAEPYTFSALNFDLFGDASADLVKGFQIYDNSLIVFCENSEWLWHMPTTDPNDWAKIQIRSSYGTKSPFCIPRYRNELLFPATQNSKIVGFASIRNGEITPSATLTTIAATGSEMESDRIEPDIFNFPENYIGNMSAMVYKNRIFLSVTYGSNATQNNRIYVYDYAISDLNRKNPAWVPYVTANAAQFAVYNGNLYYGSSLADGFVQQLETTSYNDNSSAINSYLWTKEFSGKPGHEGFEKDFRFLYMLVDMAGAYFMNVTYRMDSDSGNGTTVQVSVDPGSAVWGTLVWENGKWGSGSSQKEIIVPLNQAHGKRIQFMFSNGNTANRRFKVHGIKFMYNIRGQRNAL